LESRQWEERYTEEHWDTEDHRERYGNPENRGRAIRKGYLKIAFALVLFSGLFHMSGFFLAPVMLLSDRFLKRHTSLMGNVVIVLMILALLLPTIFGDIITRMTESVDELSDYKGHVADTGYGLGFYIFSVFRAGFAFYIFSLIRRKLIEDRYLWLAWMTIFGYFLYMVQGFEMMYRFVFYFYMLSIPFKCYVLKVDKSDNSRLYVGLSIAYLLYTFIGYTQLEQTQIFIWQYHSYLF